MTTTARPVTIDKATRVNLGILLTLIGASGGGAVYLTNLNANVLAVTQKLDKVEQAIDRTNSIIARDGKVLAVLESTVGSLLRRVEALENATK